VGFRLYVKNEKKSKINKNAKKNAKSNAFSYGPD
jgi:hypothetical protein